MRSRLLTAALLFCTMATAQAQFPQPGFGSGQPGSGPGQFGPFDQFQPYVNPNQFMPNIYNPASQPLSPYLYTVRGNNPAVDYFFGTRPGTLGMGSRGMGGAPFMAPGGNRMIFFPQLQSAPDPLQSNVTSEGSVLGPAGHPVVFNNTLGYFPSPYGQAGGARPGLGGFGGAGQKK